MKEHLLELFRYTDWANKRLLTSIHQLPDKEEAVKLFSHLITAQDKWMNRITKEESDTNHAWFGPAFPLEQLDVRWSESINKWIRLIENSSEGDLDEDLIFHRTDNGSKMRAKLKEVALQLNYHSIHHRAQTQRVMREQGLTPPVTDYIHTVLKTG